jgi:DNA invertase Pin-like site-specific DNA recombinase
MEDWKKNQNKKAIAIVRRSSTGQKDNTSAETQLDAMTRYAREHGLEFVVQPSEIIETAYASEKRSKYNKLMEDGRRLGAKHILFFNASRESRNPNDLAANTQLIKQDKIIVHHVADSKVYWKGSSDSDLLLRGLTGVINENYSRENGTRVRNACRTKAENGWFPYCHTALGYTHHKERDKNGNAIKGTAIVVPDPDTAKVKLVQREFELRAQGHSYDVIRQSNLDDGIVPPSLAKTYHRATIEKRLKNQFYWGIFRLTGDPTVFHGKHQLIIPETHLKAVKAINNGYGAKVRKTVASGEDLFRGWLTCDHPDCQRQMTYDPKTKIIKETGEKKVYHYYRCSNSRKVHMKLVNISEEKIWNQFEPAVEALTISQDFANDITAALNETHEKQKAAIKKQMEGYRIELLGLEGKEDSAYQDLKKGLLDETSYQRQIEGVRSNRRHYENEIERLTLSISDEAIVSVKKVFELAINAKELYKSMNREDRLTYLKKVCSNPTLDGLTLQYQLQSPFARLSNWKENSKWRIRRKMTCFNYLTNPPCYYSTNFFLHHF